MLNSVTPFRQLRRLYAAALSAASALDQIKSAQAHAQPSISPTLEEHLCVISTRVAALGSHAGLSGARTIGHTWQDSAQLIRELQKEIAKEMPGNIAALGWNSFAQCDEDGMIRACLQRVSQLTPLSKTFIEIGCGNGLENNTHQLLLDGYRGGWLDGSASNIAFIAEHLGELKSDQLLVTEAFVTKESVGPLVAQFREHLDETNIDFFSFDIDGNDLHLVPLALKEIAPKVLCVEYNGKFPPPSSMAMAYAGDHQWAQDDYYGASLQAWVDLFKDDYTLVSCNLSGVNAFFVRNDLASAFAVYPVEQLFQPCRYWLVGNNGHRSSMKWLKQKLRAQ
jgi:hypothetical protein